MKIVLSLMAIVLYSQQALAQFPLCVSHRSNGYGGVENSMEAFENAANFGVQAVEFDIHHTKDKKAVVYHDKKLKKHIEGSSCAIGKNVKDLSFDHIMENCRLENGETLPTLEEALRVFQNTNAYIFIEIKDYITIEDIKIIKELFASEPEKIHFLSFQSAPLKELLKLRNQDDFFMDVEIIKLSKYGFLPVKGIEKFDGLNAKYINSRNVKKLQKEGMLVGVYTKNSKKLMKLYKRRGVDFITTDRPAVCEDILH